ncbi:MAG: DNA polymerase III subunit gamma/tau [Treponema sp.]|nr:DNA polymerase III subunit gamma/tau [Treponema sp.]
MSYEVTATRRRPQQFEDLVGQEFVAETLKNSIKTGRIAHAYLFSGPRGCGKTSTARILAKALNCQNGPTDKPCGTCSNCQEITKGSSLDVIEIDGASNTSVENIRQIKDEVMFPPANCRYKIYIIDEVHMLSNSAFNALLKTIEEPPEYVIFIFATTELQKVPATIKSRCQQYNFRLVSIDKVKACLAEAAAELGIQADDEALFWIARESTGSMRDAYTLFDQVAAFSEGHITYEKIRDKLGIAGVERLNSIFEACAEGQPETVINLLDEMLQSGVSIEQIISNSADYLRSVLLIKNGVTKEALLGNSVERYSQKVLNAWNAIQVERALSIYLQLYRDIRYSLSPVYELELAFSRLCWLSEFVSNAEVKKAIDAAQSLLRGVVPAGTGTATVTSAATSGTGTSAAGANTGTGAGTSASAAAPVTGATSSSTETQKPLTINPIPNGLPRLSGLDAADDADEDLPEGGENGMEGGAENPFSNGGPLPPEQPAVQGVADERLKLHIPQENLTAEGVVPTVYIPTPTKEDSFSLNPDDESDEDSGSAASDDDDWSNTEVPPDDGYYPEDEDFTPYPPVTQGASSSSPLHNTNSQTAGSPTTGTPAQISDVFTTADGRTISVAQLKGTVMANFAVNEGFIAVDLEKTGDWVVSADGVDTTVFSEYDYSRLQKNIPTISAEIGRVCGKPMTFRVSIKTKNTASVQKEVPPQVKILVDMFKGTIVNS